MNNVFSTLDGAYLVRAWNDLLYAWFGGRTVNIYSWMGPNLDNIESISLDYDQSIVWDAYRVDDYLSKCVFILQEEGTIE